MAMGPREATSSRGPDDSAEVVTVARLERPKRHDILLKAVAELRERRDVRLTIVGTGRDEGDLRALAHRLGVADAVNFTGFVRNPGEVLARADVFALATEYEGFGNVLVEALACGLPVVVSDVPYGPAYIINDASLGTLVKPDSVESFALGLEDILLARPVTSPQRQAARSRASYFALDRIALCFETLIEERVIFLSAHRNGATTGPSRAVAP